MKFLFLLAALYPSYILSSDFILKKMREALLRFDAPLSISGKGEREISGEKASFQLKLFTDGRRLRIETSFREGKEVIVKNEKKAVRIVNGKSVPLTTSIFYTGELLSMLLYETEYRLEKFGIDTSIVSLTRHREKGIISFSIGAKDGFPEANQLWANKNSFLPVRFIFIGDGKVYDITFAGFTARDGKAFFPDRFEFSDPEGKGYLIITEWKKIEKLDETLFSLPNTLNGGEKREDTIEELIKRFEAR